jgi:hypothetical protein
VEAHLLVGRLVLGIPVPLRAVYRVFPPLFSKVRTAVMKGLDDGTQADV